MRDRIGCNCPCARGSYGKWVCPAAEGATVREDTGEADAEAVGARDGSLVGTLVRLGSALGVGALVAGGVGGVVGLLLAGGGARGTVGVTGASWWARRNGRVARTSTAQVAPAP
ncbi:hypothetical protein R6V09_48615, partial [Streptomyces sp. W16]|nr:hypothetical protein [Streptomyces sp. W16]